MLTGPDVSRHQGTVDWQAVKRAGHDFAIIKATEGTSYSYVSWFDRNWPKVKRVGLVPGAYHFLRTSDPVEQARYYVRTVGDFDGVLAVVDVEIAANGTKPTIWHVSQFAREFKRLVPNHPLIVYTGKWYWHGTIGNPYGADIGPLWHSEYDGTSPFDAAVANGPESDNYGGWAKATIWQHTSTGRCPGVSGDCDLNIFYGDLNDLRRLTGEQSTPTPELEDDDMVILRNPKNWVASLASGKLVSITGQAGLERARRAGIPVWDVDQDEWDRFVKAYGPVVG